MLIRRLRHNFARLINESETSSSQQFQKPLSTPQAQEEFLVFPTKFPIFPEYIYASKINKHLYSYLFKNNIQYVAACAMQPGVSKQTFDPQNENSLISEMGLKNNLTSNKLIKDEPHKSLEIMYNNVVFDEPIKNNNNIPVYYIRNHRQIYPIVTLCKLTLFEAEKSTYMAHLLAQKRLEINISNNDESSYPLMYVSGKQLKNENILQSGNDFQSLINVYDKISSISSINLPSVKDLLDVKATELLGGYLCTLTYFTSLQLYHLFKITSVPDRIKMLINLYKEYANSLEIKWKYFNQQYQEPTNENTEKQYIREVYERVQSLLGLKADQEYIKNIQAKLSSGKYPHQIANLIVDELENIQDLGEGNPEINKKKQYINLLINYPFGLTAKEVFDINQSREILDEDHYGMKKVKQRILEFIAVSKIKGEFKSKVLLLHGPPGVGKTSIVKSIAKCLNRPYGRISLGGEYDTSIMKGHRKTYMGAYPGKIFDTISKSKVENPVILLDEIDKVQSREGGASLQDVIMELLDPIQNHKFKDEFMDIEINLSKVLFICTANELDTIFPPLLDRLERIEVTGYTTGEKKQIFKTYIEKQSMENAGLPKDLQAEIDFTEPALHSLIEGYCKEAGIRNLVRKANTIFSKTAFKYVKNEQFDKVITPGTLKTYLGQPDFKEARMFDKIPPVGVIVGLAYNAYGGSILYIEATASKIKELSLISSIESSQTETETAEAASGHIIVTGNLHNVMKESCQLAYSYAKYITSRFFNNNFLEINDVHLNFPEIEIGKDGPSAGVAITCTLVSLALKKQAVREIAMTGEITLSGKVSAIGGVKEKTMGAKREGINTLIFPEENRRDVEELEPEIKDGITFLFADHFFSVMELVFGVKVEEKEQGETV